jgi:hypothetical protein
MARRSLPDEPTAAEAGFTRAWLGRHDITADRQTRLLALRVGSREQARRSYQLLFGLYGGVWVVVAELPVPVRFLLVSAVFAVVPLLQWRRVRPRERAAARLAPAGDRLPLRVTARQVGWWSLASVLLTFGGGVVLCVARFSTSPVAAVSWAAALAVGAGSTALVLGPALRAPVIAEDPLSLAADAVLRAQDVVMFAPSAVFALLALIDFAETWPSVPPWFPVRVGYLVLALATAFAAQLRCRRRPVTAPAGDGPGVSGSTPS